MSAFMLSVVLAVVVTLGQESEPAAKVLGIAAVMIAAGVLLVRYSLASTSRLVAARLRQCLEAAERNVAA